ncbi:hypothetical protein TBLA_0D04860 [Henningerozyma blattae CBS 6284]|uniref:Uncharacterized protein n=1 Tax=Henningerozyma blattae (strain ATCC 34711 / CBS 6284 / DSM 70876 / NBRC 10599 / NRRL Y-10934 / UCD 77-7) TaxID=1071380 RepID=I2H3N0_HENB6|nr:hypothetical protein TBLA_0D04860 [Tetrapisispora blattae CBS 6284]CCH60982.1 hypothetical protein TBLA_0D04860 [Tetrapisispora blattae CBS 6284]
MINISHSHFVLTFILIAIFGYLLYRNKEKIAYTARETLYRLRRGTVGSISLNDSFHEDLESGLSSRNFDIISKNTDDGRSGLDDESKKEIKKIMEEENLTFDKARLLFTERKFNANGIAADGTPLDPKAVIFG